MNIIQTIILGAVQGLTEFIPVSSSGHILLAQRFLGLPTNFTFDVLLNFGTLLALVLFYRKRLLDIARKLFLDRQTSYILKIIAAVIPTVIVGFFAQDFFDSLSKHVFVLITALALIGVVMIFHGKERRGVITSEAKDISWLSAAVVALVQPFALVSGVSRSGITILAGLQQRLSARAAAEFSFMLAIPTIFGASMKVLVSHEGRAFVSDNMSLFIIGNIASFIFGAIAIKVLMDFLSKRGLAAFGWYRVGLAAVLTVLLLANVIH